MKWCFSSGCFLYFVREQLEQPNNGKWKKSKKKIGRIREDKMGANRERTTLGEIKRNKIKEIEVGVIEGNWKN